jgi:hypothetical protein
MPAPPDWRRELLAEAELAWSAGQPASPEEAPSAGRPAPEEAPGPAPWVSPVTTLPRAFFTRHGYEPGARPPSITAQQALCEAVYGPCLAPLASRVLHDLPLFGALETWRPGDPGNLARTHVVFRELSRLLGEALAFKPAALQHVGHLEQHMGVYRDAELVIQLSSGLLTGPAAGLVSTIVHEQTHHLQNLLVQRLVYAPRKLTPAQRSLAMFWYTHGTVDPKANFMAYRLSGREVHANDTARCVVRDLMPLFGWGPEALMA